MIDVNELKRLLSYDQETGFFTWQVSQGTAMVGDIAGTVWGKKNATKYVRIMINKKLYRAHRLAWLYVTGEFPDRQIDHINLIGTDNRFCNLRLATLSQQQMNRRVQSNSKTGVRGCSKYRDGRYRALITVSGRTIFLGYFDSLEKASAAYNMAAKSYHGEFFLGVPDAKTQAQNQGGKAGGRQGGHAQI